MNNRSELNIVEFYLSTIQINTIQIQLECQQTKWSNIFNLVNNAYKFLRTNA